jgi:phage terminase large subunit
MQEKSILQKEKDMQVTPMDFNPDLFNNIYWHLEKIYADESIRYIWVYGGSSASKTYSAVQLTIKEMLQAPDFNTLVMRKVSVDITDSIFADFKGIIADWDLDSLFTIQRNFIKCVTGSYIRFRGLDDSEKVKGITRFKKVILEEVNQFEERDFKQIRKRLRGVKGQQILSIFNPIVESHWIKMNVFDKDVWTDQKADISGRKINEKGNSIILKTNYQDNRYIVGPNYIDQHVIDDFEWDKINDFAYYDVYALGNWGKIRTGGEFYKNFKGEKHVGKAEYNPKMPIHLSFDENTTPYFPCGVFQIYGKEARLIDTILAKNPNNTVTWMCQEIERSYRHHKDYVYIYGDATSDKDDVKQEKGVDLFKLIMNGLARFKPQRRVAPSNPNVKARGEWINDLLNDNPKAGGVKLLISERCAEAINDFYMTKEDSNGRKDKREIQDKITKERYQPHGHITDLTDYLLCYVFINEYTSYQKGPDQGIIQQRRKPREW